MTRNGKGYWIIQIKDQRLRNGRLGISLRTKSKNVAEYRVQGLRRAIAWGDAILVDAVRTGGLGVGELADAAAADDKHSNAMAALRTRFVVGDAPNTVAEAFDHTIGKLRGARRPNTVSLYESLQRAFADSADMPLADFSSIRAQRFISEPKQTVDRKKPGPWAPSTQRLNRTLLKRVWDDAIRAEAEEAERQNRMPRFRLNPWERLVMPEPEKTRLRVLSHEEWLFLADLLDDTPELGLLAAMGLGALRIGEARHLRPIDVDFAKNVIRIREHRGRYPWKPKKKRSTREVAMMPELRKILERHIELGYCGSEYLFFLPDQDRPISATAARGRVQKAFEAAGIAYGRDEDAATPHTLRHTAATWMIMAGIPVTVVAKQLGDTVAVIMNTYAHCFEGSEQEAMLRTSEVLQRAAADLGGEDS